MLSWLNGRDAYERVVAALAALLIGLVGTVAQAQPLSADDLVLQGGVPLIDFGDLLPGDCRDPAQMPTDLESARLLDIAKRCPALAISVIDEDGSEIGERR